MVQSGYAPPANSDSSQAAGTIRMPSHGSNPESVNKVGISRFLAKSSMNS
jgi:hypothetical protein